MERGVGPSHGTERGVGIRNRTVDFPKYANNYVINDYEIARAYSKLARSFYIAQRNHTLDFRNTLNYVIGKAADLNKMQAKCALAVAAPPLHTRA